MLNEPGKLSFDCDRQRVSGWYLSKLRPAMNAAMKPARRASQLGKKKPSPFKRRQQQQKELRLPLIKRQSSSASSEETAKERTQQSSQTREQRQCTAYVSGLGVTVDSKDMERKISLLEKAGQKGFEPAISTLHRLRSNEAFLSPKAEDFVSEFEAIGNAFDNRKMTRPKPEALFRGLLVPSGKLSHISGAAKPVETADAKPSDDTKADE